MPSVTGDIRRPTGYNPYKCAEMCKQYPFFALQNGGGGHCGNHYATKPEYAQVHVAECMLNGKETMYQGAKGRNYVYDRRYQTGTPEVFQWRQFGVASGDEKWNVGNKKGKGVEECYQAVMADSECSKRYFTYVGRGDKNC